MGAAGDTVGRIAGAYGLSRQLAAAMVRVAGSIGARPFDLANLINFESGWRATAINPRSGASGLIQFMPQTARGLGTTVEAIRKMSAMEQMPLVERYLMLYARKGLGTAARLYMAVFYPVAINWPRGKQFNAAVQRSNPGIKTPADYVRLANRRAKLPIGGGSARTGSTRAGDLKWVMLGAALVFGTAGIVSASAERRDTRWT